MNVRVAVRVLTVLGVVLIVSAVTSHEAFAQRQGRGGFGRMGGGIQSPLQLVALEPVQKELALKEEQVAKVKTLSEEFSSEQRSTRVDFRALQDLSQEERQTKLNEAREAGRKLNEKFEPKLAEVLDAQQKERLDQLVLQAAGGQAYQDAKVVKALNITKEQQDKFTAANTEFAEKFAELRGGDPEEGRTKMRELTTARDKQLADVLTSEQREQFAKMKGKEFDVSQLRPQFGGGRRGNREGGGGGDSGKRRRPAAKADEKT